MEKQDFLRNLLIAGGVFLIIMAVAPRLMPTPPTPPAGTTPPTQISPAAPTTSEPESVAARKFRTAAKLEEAGTLNEVAKEPSKQTRTRGEEPEGRREKTRRIERG